MFDTRIHHEKITRIFTVPFTVSCPWFLPCLNLMVPVSEPPTRPRARTVGSELAAPLPSPLPHGLGRRWA